MLSFVLFSSCATVPDTIATVNGSEISGEEYRQALNGFLANYGLTEETLYDSMGQAKAVEYKNNIIDEMVLQELMLQYAKSNDLDEISEEDSSEIKKRAESYFENLQKSFTEDVEAEGTLGGDAAEAEAKSRFDEYVSKYNYTQDTLEEQFTRQLILDRVYEHVMAGCKVDESEVRAYYDQSVKEQSQEPEDEEDVKKAIEEYTGSQSTIRTYIPKAVAEAVRSVKHILVGIPDDVQQRIAKLEADGETEEAARIREQEMKDLRARAETILGEAKSGADFDVLIAEYNDDPGMEYNPEGYQVYEGAPYDEAFLKDALSLKQVGDISSEPVESSVGYHIIQFTGQPSAGAVPYAEVHDAIADELQSRKQSEMWAQAVADWQENADIDKHEFRTPQ